MSSRAIAALLLATVCGGSASVGLYLLRTKAPQAIDEVPVVVASQEIARGELIGDAVIATRQWPRALAPASALQDVQDVMGRTALIKLSPGEPILAEKLADARSGRGLAALIPAGRRAYTIQTSHVASNVAGFVLPGNRVDVLLTLRGGREESTGGGSSTTLLQAVEILAVDDQLEAPTGNRMDSQQLRSVTLLVTPDQASLLDLGQNMGTLSLSLRNPDDVAEAATEPATVNVLRYTQRLPVPDLDGDATPAEVQPEPLESSQRADEIAEARPRIAQVRTLRGRHAGRILVRLPMDSSGTTAPGREGR